MSIPSNLRGRSTRKVRPGIVIKGVLSGNIPLTDGHLVTEAACTDVHQVYRALIKQENVGKKKPHRLKGMTYQSFSAEFRFAKYLDLIEFVRDEPLKNPPAGKALYNPVKDGEIHVVVTTRKIYRLTKSGWESEEPWHDLCSAYRKLKEAEASD